MSIGSRGNFDFGISQGQLGDANAQVSADSTRASAAELSPADAALRDAARGGQRFRRSRNRAGSSKENAIPTDAVLAKPSANGFAAKGRESQSATMSANANSVQSMLHADEKHANRRRTAAIAGILIVVTVVSLFVRTGYAAFVSPSEVFQCYGLWLQNLLAQVFGIGDALSSDELLAQNRAYYVILNRVPVTLITLLCGGLLAVAGTLYQSAFRNPIASPSMLGVSSAIQLGDMLLVLLFGISAVASEGLRYVLCYACIAVVMAVLFGCGRLMTGKGRPFNIVNLLLIATILNQIIGVIITYVTLNVFTFEQWEAYSSISEGMTVSYSPASLIMLGATCLVGLAPVMAMRFRMNSLNFDDAEMRLMGVNAIRLRIVAIVCGTVLLMGAQVEMGTVAMLALVVPHVSRMVFGAEFRKNFWGNAMMGAALLVFCRDVVGFIPYIGNLIPVSLVVNFVVLPFFVWMLATQQRGWEQ